MKTKLLLTLLLALSGWSINAQTFQKSYSGDGFNWHFPMQKTSDGGYIIAGETVSYGEGLPDVYVIKTDAIGDTLWTKTYGGTNFDHAESIKQTTDGGYIIAGRTLSFGAGNGDVYLIKTNTTGDTLWTRTYGFVGTEIAYDVLQTSDGGYILTGVTGSVGVDDIYLIKTDPSGNMTWNKTYGYGAIGQSDIGYAVLQNSDNSYIIVGTLLNNNTNQGAVCLIKTNSTGDTLWTKSYSPGTAASLGYSIQHTNDNGYIITGETRNTGGYPDILVIKTDSNGALMWSKKYGEAATDDVGYYIQQTSDNGFIVSGFTGYVGGVYHGYVIKTNITGDTLWTKKYGTTGDDGVYWIQQITGGYVASGVYSNSLGSYDICLIKMDSNGNSAGCNDSASSLTVNTPSVIVSSAPVNVSSIGAMGYTTTKMSRGGIVKDLCMSVGIKNSSIKNISMYPNPFQTQTSISLNIDLKNAQLILYDVLGQEVKNIPNISGQEIKIERGNLTDGIYFYRLKQNDQIIATGKLIAE